MWTVAVFALVGVVLLSLGMGFMLKGKDSSDPFAGFLAYLIGLGFLGLGYAQLNFYRQPIVPTDIKSVSEPLRLLHKVEVDNPCGKYVVLASKLDGSLINFCTSKEVPGPIFKYEGGKYVSYQPLGTQDASSPAK